MRSEVKEAIQVAAIIAVLITAFYFFLLPLMVGGKLLNREGQKFDAETSAQVYDNSRQYKQGINRDIARYCREWYDADLTAKDAIRDLIATTRSTYEGTLTETNRQCLAELGVE